MMVNRYIPAIAPLRLSPVQASARISDASDRLDDLKEQSWLGPTTASLAAKISPEVAWALSDLHRAGEALSSKSMEAVADTAFAALALSEFRQHADNPTYIPASTGETSVKAAAVLLSLPAILSAYDL